MDNIIGKDKDGTKLVVPKGLRQQDTPELFWPELCQDVIKFCRSCDVCQRTFKKGIVKKVPLGCVPLIAMPFKRIAVDIVGLIAPRVKQDIDTS